jgi:hypothetical protein
MVSEGVAAGAGVGAPRSEQLTERAGPPQTFGDAAPGTAASDHLRTKPERHLPRTTTVREI